MDSSEEEEVNPYLLPRQSIIHPGKKEDLDDTKDGKSDGPQELSPSTKHDEEKDQKKQGAPTAKGGKGRIAGKGFSKGRGKGGRSSANGERGNNTGPSIRKRISQKKTLPTKGCTNSSSTVPSSAAIAILESLRSSSTIAALSHTRPPARALISTGHPPPSFIPPPPPRPDLSASDLEGRASVSNRELAVVRLVFVRYAPAVETTDRNPNSGSGSGLGGEQEHTRQQMEETRQGRALKMVRALNATLVDLGVREAPRRRLAIATLLGNDPHARVTPEDVVAWWRSNGAALTPHGPPPGTLPPPSPSSAPLLGTLSAAAATLPPRRLSLLLSGEGLSRLSPEAQAVDDAAELNEAAGKGKGKGKACSSPTTAAKGVEFGGSGSSSPLSARIGSRLRRSLSFKSSGSKEQRGLPSPLSGSAAVLVSSGSAEDLQPTVFLSSPSTSEQQQQQQPPTGSASGSPTTNLKRRTSWTSRGGLSKLFVPLVSTRRVSTAAQRTSQLIQELDAEREAADEVLRTKKKKKESEEGRGGEGSGGAAGDIFRGDNDDEKDEEEDEVENSSVVNDDIDDDDNGGDDEYGKDGGAGSSLLEWWDEEKGAAWLRERQVGELTLSLDTARTKLTFLEEECERVRGMASAVQAVEAELACLQQALEETAPQVVRACKEAEAAAATNATGSGSPELSDEKTQEGSSPTTETTEDLDREGSLLWGLLVDGVASVEAAEVTLGGHLAALVPAKEGEQEGDDDDDDDDNIDKNKTKNKNKEPATSSLGAQGASALPSAVSPFSSAVAVAVADAGNFPPWSGCGLAEVGRALRALVHKWGQGLAQQTCSELLGEYLKHQHANSRGRDRDDSGGGGGGGGDDFEGLGGKRGDKKSDEAARALWPLAIGATNDAAAALTMTLRGDGELEAGGGNECARALRMCRGRLVVHAERLLWSLAARPPLSSPSSPPHCESNGAEALCAEALKAVTRLEREIGRATAVSEESEETDEDGEEEDEVSEESDDETRHEIARLLSAPEGGDEDELEQHNQRRRRKLGRQRRQRRQRQSIGAESDEGDLETLESASQSVSAASVAVRCPSCRQHDLRPYTSPSDTAVVCAGLPPHILASLLADSGAAAVAEKAAENAVVETMNQPPADDDHSPTAAAHSAAGHGDPDFRHRSVCCGFYDARDDDDDNGGGGGSDQGGYGVLLLRGHSFRGCKACSLALCPNCCRVAVAAAGTTPPDGATTADARGMALSAHRRNQRLIERSSKRNDASFDNNDYGEDDDHDDDSSFYGNDEDSRDGGGGVEKGLRSDGRKGDYSQTGGVSPGLDALFAIIGLSSLPFAAPPTSASRTPSTSTASAAVDGMPRSNTNTSSSSGGGGGGCGVAEGLSSFFGLVVSASGAAENSVSGHSGGTCPPSLSESGDSGPGLGEFLLSSLGTLAATTSTTLFGEQSGDQSAEASAASPQQTPPPPLSSPSTRTRQATFRTPTAAGSSSSSSKGKEGSSSGGSGGARRERSSSPRLAPAVGERKPAHSNHHHPSQRPSAQHHHRQGPLPSATRKSFAASPLKEGTTLNGGRRRHSEATAATVTSPSLSSAAHRPSPGSGVRRSLSPRASVWSSSRAAATTTTTTAASSQNSRGTADARKSTSFSAAPSSARGAALRSGGGSGGGLRTLLRRSSASMSSAPAPRRGMPSKASAKQSPPQHASADTEELQALLARNSPLSAAETLRVQTLMRRNSVSVLSSLPPQRKPPPPPPLPQSRVLRGKASTSRGSNAEKESNSERSLGSGSKEGGSGAEDGGDNDEVSGGEGNEVMGISALEDLAARSVAE